ncbi:MAG TPA: hypothetical protein VNT03_02775 [Baekduia sp.]|nr:hypothetical protein [Baekduia sp.]
MSSVRAAEPSAPPRPDRGDAVAAPAARWRARAASPWAWVAGLYLLAAAAYLVLSLRTRLPVLFPDEFRYSHLARSLADGEGFDWRGQHVGQSAALYVYFITPAWALLHSTVDAWHASKALGTLALCAQLVPVWLLARDVVGPRLALLPAALSVGGTWMLTSAETATEALAFPLATAALCVFALGLLRVGGPTSRRLLWLAFALLALATWARIQLAVLVPALLVALILDILRDPAQRSVRLREHRSSLVAAAVVFAVLAIVALAAPGVTGDYRFFFDVRPPLGRVLSKTGLQLLELAAVGGLLPILLAAAGALSPRAWRDDRTGPLLAVFWPAALATALQSGVFLADYTPATWGIGRYVTYALPLALVLATVLVAHPPLLSRAALAGAALVALTLLARPAVDMIGEERATWGLAYRLDQALGLGTGVALTLVALALLGVVALQRARGAPGARAAVVAFAATALVLAVQDQAAWWQMQKTASSFRATMPADLEWVDHHARGPVALLGVTQNAPQFDDIDFFNRKVTQAYVPEAGLAGRAVQGKLCSFRFAVSGALQTQRDCGPVPHRFLINDPSARITFHDEVASASHPDVGRVVEIAPEAEPRARSLIVLPCPRRTPGYRSDSPDITPPDVPIACRGALTGALWLDDAGQVEIRYAGGLRDQVVEAGGRRWTLPAGVATTVWVRVAKGYSQFTAQQDWTSSAATPRVLSVTLIGGGRGGPARLA